jgi:hypothetical protein
MRIRSSPTRLAPSRPLAGHRWAVAEPWFTAEWKPLEKF